jgi:hypothetical protein
MSLFESLKYCLQCWVYAFRKDLYNIRVSTTNGLERQHRHRKESYLKKAVQSLTGMLTTLIQSYLPECRQRYIYYMFIKVYKLYIK